MIRRIAQLQADQSSRNGLELRQPDPAPLN